MGPPYFGKPPDLLRTVTRHESTVVGLEVPNCPRHGKNMTIHWDIWEEHDHTLGHCIRLDVTCRTESARFRAARVMEVEGLRWILPPSITSSKMSIS